MHVYFPGMKKWDPEVFAFFPLVLSNMSFLTFLNSTKKHIFFQFSSFFFQFFRFFWFLHPCLKGWYPTSNTSDLQGSRSYLSCKCHFCNDLCDIVDFSSLVWLDQWNWDVYFSFCVYTTCNIWWDPRFVLYEISVSSALNFFRLFSNQHISKPMIGKCKYLKN